MLMLHHNKLSVLNLMNPDGKRVYYYAMGGLRFESDCIKGDYFTVK